jgi:hyaluronoglucosaminidase
MSSIGVVEGFFGPAWSDEERKSYAPFLKKVGGEFYIYAPKQDQHLRKSWRQTWDESFITHMESLRDTFHAHGIKFGVAISPFGLGTALGEEDSAYLEEKMSILKNLNLDILGVFFDDMPVNENLASVQVEVLHLISQTFKRETIFCPTFYCFDPILEKVFGKKPEGYLEDVGENVPAQIEIAWTGPKVISPEISLSHIQEVRHLLKRKPFIWENIFANDGPKNCKFLKIKPFSGRDSSLDQETSAWAFNMMNQGYLSQITFLASVFVLKEGIDPEAALDRAIDELCSTEFAAFLRKRRAEFLDSGLDKLSDAVKGDYIRSLENLTEPAAQEIVKWLKGEYVVGNECLTD